MDQGLSELIKKRKKWVDANRENGFEGGINNLLTQLYPDNAHFIYELLQNAEDPGATSVKFKLSDASIEFEHNGDRLFDIDDVDSITSIGNSTKSDDPTSIGKFGVGFKAVFAYTSTPEIRSGKFHLKIQDLVVPLVVEKNSSSKKTCFSFPFDHPKKAARHAVEEVAKGLKNLGSSTLLFLSNIREINYELPDGSKGFVKRVDDVGGRIEIKSKHAGSKDTISYWLRFQKDVLVFDDEDKDERRCKIAIAYKLSKEEKNQNDLQTIYKVVPLDRGQVSIFFPAEKETSNLRFHLHAPFASTVARDSVRSCKANSQLRDHISDLIVESFVDIREKGMLTMSFLKVLPNIRDSIPPFYEPIREAIVRAFKSDRFTPTKDGSHAPANTLYRGPVKISSVLGDEEMAVLTGQSKPLWAANPPQLYQREDHFLDSLDLVSWEWTELAQVMSPSDAKCDELQELVTSKDDKWLLRFYSLLGETIDDYGESVSLENCPIVRVDNNGIIEHVRPKNAFFRSDAQAEFPGEISFVKPSVYRIGKSTAQQENATLFLQHIGVRHFNARTIIELKLTQHNEYPKSSDDQSYYRELVQFIKYWKESQDDELFESCRLILGVAPDGKKYWCVPSRLALDSPYEETGFSKFQETHSKHIISGSYAKYLNQSEIGDFVDFLKSIGVMYELKISDSITAENPDYLELCKDFFRPGVRKTLTGVDFDYTIKGIKSYLEKPSIPISRTIWKCLTQAEPMCGKARFRPNRQHPIRESESQLIHHLRCHAWIPDKFGNFKKPSDLSVDTLRSDFPYDNRNGLLTAIRIGEQEKKKSEKYLEKEKAAKAAGFDNAEEQEKWRRVKELGVSPDELLTQYSPEPNDPTEYELPERSAGRSDIRQKRLAEEAKKAPERAGEERTRTVKINKPPVKEEARQYLKDNYTNLDDSMSCQICKSELPFKQRDGSYYFESVEFLSEANKYYPQNYLALCPNHAAMFRLVNDSENHLKTELLDVGDEVEFPVVLAGDEYSIYFTQRHIADLKTVLGVDATPSETSQENSDEQKPEPPSVPTVERQPGYLGIVFPTGLDTWKKAHCFQNGRIWVVAKRDGAVAQFDSKEQAEEWWIKFCEHRQIAPPPPMKEGRPKPKAKKIIVKRAITNRTKATTNATEKGTCPVCYGDGGLNGGCYKCQGTGWLG